MFTIGEQVLYVELKDGGAVKRYLFPNELTVMPKLKSFLEDYPNIMLIRQSIGSIKSAMEPAESVMELVEIPTKVDGLFNISMPGHPDVPEAFGRYSKELIDLVASHETKEESGVSKMHVVTGNEANNLTDSLRNQVSSSSQNPSADLTAQLKGQIAERQSRPPAIASSPSHTLSLHQPQHQAANSNVNKPNSADDEVFDFEDYICRYVEEIEDIVLENKDLLVEIVDQLALMNRDIFALKSEKIVTSDVLSTITAQQLQKWFAEAAGVKGFDHAFEILAEKLRSGKDTAEEIIET